MYFPKITNGYKYYNIFSTIILYLFNKFGTIERKLSSQSPKRTKREASSVADGKTYSFAI